MSPRWLSREEWLTPKSYTQKSHLMRISNSEGVEGVSGWLGGRELWGVGPRGKQRKNWCNFISIYFCKVSLKFKWSRIISSAFFQSLYSQLETSVRSIHWTECTLTADSIGALCVAISFLPYSNLSPVHLFAFKRVLNLTATVLTSSAKSLSAALPPSLHFLLSLGG